MIPDTATVTRSAAVCLAVLGAIGIGALLLERDGENPPEGASVVKETRESAPGDRALPGKSTVSERGTVPGPPGTMEELPEEPAAGSPAGDFPLGRRLAAARAASEAMWRLREMAQEGGVDAVVQALREWRALLGESRRSERSGLLAGLSICAWKTGEFDEARRTVRDSILALADWDPESTIRLRDLSWGPGSFPWLEGDRVDPLHPGTQWGDTIEDHWATCVGAIQYGESKDYARWLLDLSERETDPVTAAAASLWAHAIWTSGGPGNWDRVPAPAAARILREQAPGSWPADGPPPKWAELFEVAHRLEREGVRCARDLLRVGRYLSSLDRDAGNRQLQREWSLREDVVLRYRYHPDLEVQKIVRLAESSLDPAWSEVLSAPDEPGDR